MDAQITCIGVINADGHRVAPQPALVVHFADVPGAMPLLDQALELRIQAIGMLMHAQMLDFQRTGKAKHRTKAQSHLNSMRALIAARSPERVAAMERAVGGRDHA
jgi:hypothetical protein